MSLNPPQSDARDARAIPEYRPPQRLRLSSEELLRGTRELLIQHGEHEYRLRLTQNDKLILTK